jgi:virginiamycin B lyase
MTTSGQISILREPANLVAANQGAGPLTSAQDGSLWWVNMGNSSIGELTASGVFENYPLNPPIDVDPFSSPFEANLITAGPDGNVWFAVPQYSAIDRITPAGVITAFSLPSKFEPDAIIAGPDGNLWFTNADGKPIGVMSTAGVLLDRYSVAPVAGSSFLNALGATTVGPDGNLYFAMEQGDIGEITTSGAITETPIPTGILESRHDAPDHDHDHFDGGGSIPGRHARRARRGRFPARAR